MRNARFIVFCFFVVGLPAAAKAQGTELTTCGQTISGMAFLSADLDCSASTGYAVTMNGGELDIRGFTLTGASLGAVECTAACTVTSTPPGGMIVTSAVGVRTQGVGVTAIDVVFDVNADGSGIDAGDSRVVARGVTFMNGTSTGTAILGAFFVKMDSCTVNDMAFSGIEAFRKIRIRDSQFTNVANAVVTDRAVVMNTTITGASGDGVQGAVSVKVLGSTVSGFAEHGILSFGFTKVAESTISNNGKRGIWSFPARGVIKIRNSIISGNAEEGVFNRGPVRVTDGSQITGNGLDGISSGPGPLNECNRVKIVDSTVTGNGLNANCGVSQTCADLSTCIAPIVTNSSCDRSYDTNSGFPGTDWDVCSLD